MAYMVVLDQYGTMLTGKVRMSTSMGICTNACVTGMLRGTEESMCIACQESLVWGFVWPLQHK